MTTLLTKEDIDLLNEPQIASVATLNADGSIHVTPVWVDTDGEAVIFNTAKGRVKHQNIERDPSISVIVVDSSDSHRWLSVRGRAEITEEGADAHVDRLAKKYLGSDTFPAGTQGQVRVVVRVVPEHRLAG